MPVSINVNRAALDVAVERINAVAQAAALAHGHMARVGTDIRYAPAVVYGSRPHMILPKTKHALYWKGARHPVPSVRHPGNKPNPFMQVAAEQSEPEINTIFAAAMQEAINGNVGAFRNALLPAGLAVQANVQRGSPVKTGTLRRSFFTVVE